jgi:anaerobic ribonucleoside-triphosphate reductase
MGHQAEKADGVGNECKVEVYSRVTGYMQPVVKWNHGKQEEFKARKAYKTDSRHHPRGLCDTTTI